VSAEVEDKYSPKLFTLDEDKIGVGPDVLVIAPDGTNIEDGDIVAVTGVVRRYERTELKRDYDWFELGAEYGVKYTSRPVIIADSIVKVKD